jgi:cell division protease FtsH
MFADVGAPGSGIGSARSATGPPAIIVIDEMDMTGHRRSGSGAVIADDEREQTLNLLLAEMDGFDVTQGIVVLAATYRPEVLGPALLRPGRFDRQVAIPLPALVERPPSWRCIAEASSSAPSAT